MYLLPEPKKIQIETGSYIVDYRRRIVIGNSCGENVFLYGTILQETIRQWCGLNVPVVRGSAKAGDILLQIVPEKGSDKTYRLQIREEAVAVSGVDEELLFNGIQTLRQIIQQLGGILPCMEVWDQPDQPNRGFYHDVTRGRVPHLAELKKMVDVMCSYKLNQLQLYVEHTYLFEDFSEMWRDETPLTAQEILELDEYCAKRHVELVPSLSCFGHLYKLLRTDSYEELCELDGVSGEPFSFRQRMAHHTINVSNPKSLETIIKMISEYMVLFRSSHFNICADETFDLCKGRSSSLLKEKNVKDVFTGYVRQLSEFLIEKGKVPMFWGDVLWDAPEKIRDLPAENICLNWGYERYQREEETKVIAEAGGVQYTCPGVGGWNEWINQFRSSYDNITRLCTYAMKYKAIGVLNTDWGDYGHINQPELSRPGLIYGAAFSWNSTLLDYEEINRRISVLEFHDPSGTIMEVLSEISPLQSFKWREAVVYREMKLLGESEEERKKLLYDKDSESDPAENNKNLLLVRKKLIRVFAGADTSGRELLHKYLLGIDAIMLWNRVKPAVKEIVYGEEAGSNKQFGNTADRKQQERAALASELEKWFMHYKEEWRKVSREGDLRHLSAIVFWYCDLLRKGKEMEK